LGAIIVFVFASLFNDTLLIPLLAVAGILLANTLKSYIFKPIIIGDKINLNAFIIFLSVIVGGMVWGVTGMILFMPLVGIVKVLLEYNEKTKPLGALLSTVPKGALHQIDEQKKNAPEK
jgi:predicted PurR-regulated permease PerM